MLLGLLLGFLLSASGGVDRWEEVQVPTRASLRGLSAVDEKIIWASGTEGTVIRTVDGGATWAMRTVAGAEKLDFRGIRAFDGELAFVMSSGNAEDGMARIYRTTDGGVKWTLVFETRARGVFLDAIKFWDREHGIVLSDPVDVHFVLFTTEDSGKTWNQIPKEQIPPALPGEGAFAASNSCMVVQGAKNVWFATGGASVARVFRSNDRGQTWSVSETPLHPSNGSSGIFSVAFRDALNGVAVGGDYAHPASGPMPNVIFTSDGGKTWNGGERTNAPGLYLSAVTYLPVTGGAPPETGVIFGAGSTGTNSLVPGSRWLHESDDNFNTVAFPRSGTGWAVGPKGRVARRKR